MKKNLLSIIILALLVVNIVLSSIIMIILTSSSKKTAAPVSDISTIIGLEINGLPKSETAGSVSMANTEVYNISDELTIPLKNNEDGTEHFAVGKVSLSMDKTNKDYETYSATLESKEGLITDIIFSVFGSHTIDEAKSNPEVLKSEILQKIQELCGSDFIYGVSFNFLYQ